MTRDAENRNGEGFGLDATQAMAGGDGFQLLNTNSDFSPRNCNAPSSATSTYARLPGRQGMNRN